MSKDKETETIAKPAAVAAAPAEEAPAKPDDDVLYLSINDHDDLARLCYIMSAVRAKQPSADYDALSEHDKAVVHKMATCLRKCSLDCKRALQMMENEKADFSALTKDAQEMWLDFAATIQGVVLARKVDPGARPNR